MELDSVAKELDEIENSIDDGDKSDNLLRKRDELRDYYHKLSKQYKEITGKSVAEASRLSTAGPSKVMRTEKETHSFTLGIFLVLASNLLFISALYNLIIPGLLGYTPQAMVEGFQGAVETVDQTVIDKMAYALLITSVTGVSTIVISLLTFIIGFAKKSVGTGLNGLAIFLSSTVIFYGKIAYLYGFMNQWDSIWPLKEGVIMLSATLVFSGILYLNITFLATNSGMVYRILSLLEGILCVVAGAYAYVQVQNNASFTSHYIWTSGFLMLVAGIGAMSSFFLKYQN